jgi:4a-hydroxytetrahydrobiopterin dehydratase
MTELKKEKCTACSKGVLPIPQAEIAELKPQIPEWQILIYDEIPRLERVFRFRNFAEALEFTVKVGELAERENHHPAILTEWAKATITWWTHAIGGLHRNDFIMAAKTNALFDAVSSGTA